MTPALAKTIVTVTMAVLIGLALYGFVLDPVTGLMIIACLVWVGLLFWAVTTLEHDK